MFLLDWDPFKKRKSKMRLRYSAKKLKVMNSDILHEKVNVKRKPQTWHIPDED